MVAHTSHTRVRAAPESNTAHRLEEKEADKGLKLAIHIAINSIFSVFNIRCMYVPAVITHAADKCDRSRACIRI